MKRQPDVSRWHGALPVPDTLEGPRIVVRPFEQADAPALQRAIAESREHLRPWMPWADTHQEIEETQHFCARSKGHWLARDEFGGGVFSKADGRVLGGIGLHPRDWPARVFEIGYWLHPAATGHGYAREGVGLLTRLAFDVLGANRVFIRCDALNDRSRKVAEGSGFTFEGCLRHDALTPQGTLRDTLVFGLLREEYEGRVKSDE